MTQREFSWRPDVLEAVFSHLTESEANSPELQKLLDAVAAAVEALPDRERETLELHFWGRMSQRAIARRQGCCQKNIFRVIERAKRMLADELEPHLDDYIASR